MCIVGDNGNGEGNEVNGKLESRRVQVYQAAPARLAIFYTCMCKINLTCGCSK